jgi:hypothetical protein
MPIKKRKGLSEWATIAIIPGVVLFLLPFYYFDRMDLARPGLFSATAIGLAIATRWKLRTRRWFWVVIAMVAALHVFVMLRVQWDEDRISPYIIGILALIDYGLVLAFIWLLEIICRTPEEAESRRRKSLS